MELNIMDRKFSVLDSSLYWYFETLQYLSSLYQLRKFILASGSITDQVTIDLYSYLYNIPHKK